MEKKKIPIGGFNKDSRDSDIEDFAENIKKYGLIEPIRVVKNSENKFEVREGQRRINAFQVLNENNPGQGFDKIDAIIFDNIEEYEEVIFYDTMKDRVPMPPDVLNQAVIDLYTNFSNVKIVAEKLGLTEAQVKKIIRDVYPETTFDNNTERG
jgi:hypothetical protein